MRLLLPKGDAVERLLAYRESHHPQSPPLTAERLNGLLMVASIIWSGRNGERKTMQLPKQHSLRFVRSLGPGINPATFVCRAWGCELLTKGTSLNGKAKRTNVWAFPVWAGGKSQSLPVTLTPYQAKRWANKKSILLRMTLRAIQILAVAA